MRQRGRVGGAIAVLVGAMAGLAGCGGGDEDIVVRPFEEVQAGELIFEVDPLDPSRAIFRVETTEPMICAIVWGETDELGRFNNSLSMNGTGITDHDVVLPEAETGIRYHYVVQGTTADGTLYRSEPATFVLEAVDAVGTDDDEPVPDLGTNLAPDGTVVEASSAFSDSFAADLAIDDDLATEWSTSDDGDDGYLVIDLGSVHEVAALEFVTRSMADGSAVTSTFTVSVDGGAPLGPFDAASPATRRVATVELVGQRFRFDVERSSGGNVGAVEVRLFGPP